MKKIIASAKAPGAIGPYSQAVAAGGLLFVSGQLPVDPATGAFVSEDIGELTARSLENLKAILEEAGCGLSDVVKTIVFLKDMGDFAAMNKVYAEYFASDCPARSAVEVAALPKGSRIEIEAIAVLPNAK